MLIKVRFCRVCERSEGDSKLGEATAYWVDERKGQNILQPGQMDRVQAVYKRVMKKSERQ